MWAKTALLLPVRMKLAHVAAKTDKRTANMFNTVKKWEKKYKESKKLYIHTKRKLKKLRDIPVEQKVEDYRKKQIDKFNKKHPKLLAKHKQSSRRCAGGMPTRRLIKRRIASLRSTTTFRGSAASAAVSNVAAEKNLCTSHSLDVLVARVVRTAECMMQT